MVEPLSPRTIVPGHGETCGPEVTDNVLGYLRFVQESVARQGRGGSQCSRRPATPIWGSTGGLAIPSASWATCTGPTSTSTPGLRAAGSRTRLDYPAILAYMVAYNGGKPLT